MKLNNTVVSPVVDIKTDTQNFVHVTPKPVYEFLKRGFDIVVSILGIIILFVPLLILSFLILIESPGAPAIYSHKRVGKNGKVFKLYKFRSMVPHAEDMLEDLLPKNEMQGPVFKIKNDPRITKIGKFIRKTSIDEIPQLINVLRGEMSLVGPRPPLEREVVMYNEYQKQRLMVTPGITCLWQVQPKRNSLTFDEWLKLDLEYIEKRNFLFDIIILFKTIGAVCGMEGE